METLIYLLTLTAVLAFNQLGAYTLGWLFTEVLYLPLQFKPFNCRPCLTFWITVILNVTLAITASPYLVKDGVTASRFVAIYGVTGAGILAAFINFLYIKLKFKIYE